MARRYTRSIAQALAGREGPGAAANPDLRSMVDRPGSVAWLGHASVLFRHGGLTILTDPVFSERIGPRVMGRVLGPSRLAAAPLRPEDLPPIDLILISHAHFDHLDRPTLRAIASPRTVVVTAKGTRRLIPRGFGPVFELDWGERRALPAPGRIAHSEAGGVEIRALRPVHWGARRGVDRRRGYCSYLVSADGPGRAGGGDVLFAGDTADTDEFEGLGRGAQLRLGIFGIGSYDPWEHMHATPEQAWRMFEGTGAAHLLPVHHSTFQLGDEPEGAAMERLIAAAGEGRSRIIEVRPGELWTQG